MKALKFDEKQFLMRFKAMKPKYLFMNENTLALIEKDWSGSYESIPHDLSFVGYVGTPILLEKQIPIGEIIFGVE